MAKTLSPRPALVYPAGAAVGLAVGAVVGAAVGAAALVRGVVAASVGVAVGLVITAAVGCPGFGAVTPIITTSTRRAAIEVAVHHFQDRRGFHHGVFPGSLVGV
jgi:hypothetical protein